jgi:hypothetical protein
MKESWFENAVNTNEGIWVGNNVDVQTCIKFNNMSKSDISESFKGLCYVSNGDTYQVVKGVGTVSETEGGDLY